MKNYYQVLQVDPAAEKEVIEAAYRRLASKYHPDKNKSPNATAKMQELNEAYEILRDFNKRKQYDNDRKAKQEPPKQEFKQAATASKEPSRASRESKTTSPNPPPRPANKAKARQPDKIHYPHTDFYPKKEKPEKGGMYIKLFGTTYHFTNDQWENIGVATVILLTFLTLFMVFLYYYSKASG